VTLYTLAHSGKTNRWKKTALVYGILAAFCGAFSAVYLQFSHGESSPFLIWLFAPSLLLGMLPALLMSRIESTKRPGIAIRRIWNSAIATLSVGMLVRAIVNISGRYTEYDTIYWIASGVLFAAAVVLSIKRTVNRARLIGSSGTII